MVDQPQYPEKKGGCYFEDSFSNKKYSIMMVVCGQVVFILMQLTKIWVCIFLDSNC
jgi:hypothetical protein